MATTAHPPTKTVTLTMDPIDPMGKIPEFKFCAVRVEPAANGAGR